MNAGNRLRILSVAFAALGWVFLPVSATVDVVVAAGPDPARAGELLEVELTVANSGPFDRTDVTVLLDMPANLGTLFVSTFAGSCPGTACESGEQATFTIPLLNVGTAVTFSVPARVAPAAADSVNIPFLVHVMDDLNEIATGSGSVSVSTPRTLELAVTQDQDPRQPGEWVTYSMHWGLAASSPGVDGALLSFPLPTGTSFVSASNGELPAGGVVDWSLGSLNPGDRGREEITLSIDGANDEGSALVAAAQLTENAGGTVTSRVATRIAADDSQEFRLVASPDPVRPGEILDLEMIVANDGSFDRTDSQITLEYPEHFDAMFWNTITDGSCAGTSCDATENQTFLLGTRVPDSAISRSVPPTVAAATPAGSVIPIVGVVRDHTNAEARAGGAFAVSPTREWELELTQVRDTVAPGETLDFRLNWGLIDTSLGATDATLAFRFPPETTVERVTGSGATIGDEVLWSLGNLDPGDHGAEHVRVRVEGATPLGSILLAEARVVAASAAPMFVRQLPRVELRSPLEIDVIVSPDAARPGEIMDLEITVTNTAAFERTGIELLFELPDHLNSLFVTTFEGSCPGTTCDRRERAVFDIGTLQPGEGRMFAAAIRPGAAVPDGTTVDIEAELRAGGDVIESASSFAVDSNRRLELALLESDEPVVPGGQLTYTLLYGTTSDGGGIDNALLELTLPDEVTTVAVSNNGGVNGNVVTWPIGQIQPGAGGSRTVIVQVDGGVADGALLRARSRFLDPANEEENRFSETTRVESVRPFDVSFDIAQTHVAPAAPFDIVLSLRNDSGFERTDVTLSVEIPDELEAYFHSATPGTCPGTTCDATENLVFAIPSLPVGETVAFPLQFTVDNVANPGTVLNFDAYATDSTGFFSHDGDGLMAGTQFDAAGPKPAAGAGSVPDGSGGVPLRLALLTPDTLLLTWGESCIPGDTDYAIYRGSIGDFTQYSPLECSTSGTEGEILLTPAQSTFYLVVPVNGSREGSYGRRGDGSQRPAGNGACLPQQIADTCEP